MEFLIVGIAISFNIIVILWKFSNNRLADAVLDTILLIAVTYVFSGSYGALVAGTIASAIVSLYLLIIRPQLPNNASDISKWVDSKL